jgi:hypothetical protein
MSAKAKSVIDKYLQRSVQLLRAAEGEADEIADELNEVFLKIAKTIRAEGELLKRNRLLTVTEQIESHLESFYGQMLPESIATTALDVIEKEIAWNLKVLTDETAQQISIPKKTEVAARAASKTYQGHKFEYWTKKEFGSVSKQANTILRQGYIESKPIAQIEKELSDLTGRSRRNVRTIVRSNFMHNATEAKETVFGINPSIVEGAIWESILDNRTTPFICGLRDGKMYDEERNPVGHSLPWDAGPGRIHWNCRSISIPKLTGVDYNGTRAATEPGEHYERGDDKTRTGKVRKNTKAAREKGIFETAQHSAETRYESWLRDQSKTNIDFVADVLGNKRDAELFRDGKTSLFKLGLESPVARPLNRSSL